MTLAFAAILAAALLVSSAAAVETGNGAISGKHYNLNLIGMEKNDKLPNDANSGARIFVNLVGRSKIYLKEGTDFGVTDADATDGRGEFMLPPPVNEYENGEYAGPGRYQVFIRALGKPGPATATLSSCVEYMENGELITECSTGEENIVELQRVKGQPKFDDVTRELTTVVIDGVRYDIFDEAFATYLWAYDNDGLKHVQLRFYPIEEPVAG
ncbi:MAG: hypothetical protein LUQ12_03850 [Methanoregulaceae archaeon]|nr:hypothetical protein [Methanoregulaceae archaeon]